MFSIRLFYQKILPLILIATCVVGCTSFSNHEILSDSSKSVWYQTDLAAGGESGWFTYPLGFNGCKPLEIMSDENGVFFARSKGPWWLDANHAPPGLGYLHLLAFAYSYDWSEDGVIQTSGSETLDLRNATIHIRWRPVDLKLPQGAQIHLWFQTDALGIDPVDSSRVNFLLMDQHLKANPVDSGWQETTLRLNDENSKYACMGSNPAKASLYSCAINASEALRGWNVNLGLVIFFQDPSLSNHIDGALDIQHIEIRVEDRMRLTTDPELALRAFRRKSTCRS